MTQSPQLVTYNWAGPIALVNKCFGDSNRQMGLKRGQDVKVLALPLPLTLLPANRCLRDSDGPNTIGEVRTITCSYGGLTQYEERDWGTAAALLPQFLIGRGVIHLDPEAGWAQTLLHRDRQWVEGHFHVTGVEEKNRAWWHGFGRTLGLDVPEPLEIATDWRLNHVNLLTGPSKIDKQAPGRTPCYIELTDEPAG